MNEHRDALNNKILSLLEYIITLGFLGFVIWISFDRTEKILQIFSDGWLCWASIVVLFFWIHRERTLRKSKTKSMSDRITKLEAEKNPKRTSSGPTPTDETHPN